MRRIIFFENIRLLTLKPSLTMRPGRSKMNRILWIKIENEEELPSTTPEVWPRTWTDTGFINMMTPAVPEVWDATIRHKIRIRMWAVWFSKVSQSFSWTFTRWKGVSNDVIFFVIEISNYAVSIYWPYQLSLNFTNATWRWWFFFI